jgi:integrase
MASLQKRGRSFRVAFRFQGIRYTRSLSTRSEKAAVAAFARLEDNLHRLELGTLELPEGGDLAGFLLGDGRAKRSRNASAASLPAEPETLTLVALFEAFWRTLPAGSLEQSTITGMKIHQRQLEKHFRKDFLLGSLTLTQLQEYVERRSRDEGLHGRKVTATTIKKAIVTLRTVWNWGRQHELIAKEFPSKGIKYPKGIEKLPFMTFAEVERRVRKAPPAAAAELWECAFLSLSESDELLRAVKDRAVQPSVYPMFVFAAHTGARRSEIIRSTLNDLDFEHGLITIQERKKSHDRWTTRRVPMTPLLWETMQKLLLDHPGLDSTFWHELLPQRGHRRIDPQPLDADTAHYYFKHTLAGTMWEHLRGWHVFRHSFCSNAAAAGVDQRVIDAWVGHQTEEMVRRYRHLLPDQQQNALNLVFGTATTETSSAAARSA